MSTKKKILIFVIIWNIVFMFIIGIVLKSRMDNASNYLEDKVKNTPSIVNFIEENYGHFENVHIANPFWYGQSNGDEFIYEAFITTSKEDSNQHKSNLVKIVTYREIKNPIALIIDQERYDLLPSFDINEYQNYLEKEPVDQLNGIEDYKDVCKITIKYIDLYFNNSGKESSETILYYDLEHNSWLSETIDLKDHNSKMQILITDDGNVYLES